MKVNLLYNSDSVLSGFINIDPLASDQDVISGKKIKGDFYDLNWVVEDAECTDIIAEDVLNYFPGETVDQVIDNWIRKLRHKGKIIISGVDLFELSRGINGRYINLVDANIMLYGENGQKKSILSGLDLSDALKDCGLKIIKIRFNSYKYVIEAERP